MSEMIDVIIIKTSLT